MNAFLVVLRHTMDDLPLRLFASRDEAEAFAKTVDEMPTKQIRDTIGTDCSTPLHVAIYEFNNGELVQCENVVDFET